MKKISSILLIIVLVIGMFSACGPKEDVVKVKTAKEVVESAEEKMKEIGNTEFAAEMSLDLGVTDPALGLSGPIGMKLKGEVFNDKNIRLNLDLDTGQGIVISGEIFIKDDLVLIHAPILASFLGGQYIQMDLATLTETSGIDTSNVNREKILEIVDNFKKEKNLTNTDIMAIDETILETEIVINEVTLETKKISAVISVDKMAELAVSFLDYVAENQAAQDVFFENLSQEEIEATLTQIKSDEIRLSIEEVLKTVVIHTFDLNLYVDDQELPAKLEYELDFDVNEEVTPTNIKSSGNLILFNIGKVEEIILPEVDENEIIDFNDFY